jgi:hypothetical protein
MLGFRTRAAGATAVLVLTAGLGATPVAAADPEEGPVAYLDGRAIPLADVGRYYCDDFDYPAIRCSRSPLLPSVRGTVVSQLSSVTYVTIWDGSGFTGPFMNVSQDYASLLTIGWNDAVSSFKVRNSETGRFTSDWFYGGSSWWFCCNSTFSTLGAWNNTFSAVQRT